ncbi:hypothetical protein HK101_007215, partial [Irineochytrium annulatum]
MNAPIDIPHLEAKTKTEQKTEETATVHVELKDTSAQTSSVLLQPTKAQDVANAWDTETRIAHQDAYDRARGRDPRERHLQMRPSRSAYAYAANRARQRSQKNDAKYLSLYLERKNRAPSKTRAPRVASIHVQPRRVTVFADDMGRDPREATAQLFQAAAELAGVREQRDQPVITEIVEVTTTRTEEPEYEIVEEQRYSDRVRYRSEQQVENYPSRSQSPAAHPVKEFQKSREERTTERRGAKGESSLQRTMKS